jgi:hypothetical protein
MIDYSLFRTGDVLAAWGPKSNIISALIEDCTNGGPSHVALIRQPWIPPAPPQVIECTLDSTVNGVRTIGLDAWLKDQLPGERVELYRLTDAARARLDLFDFYQRCGQWDGHERYDVLALLRFLLPEFMQRALDPDVERAKSMVCSIFATAILRDSKGLPADINPELYAPINLISRSELQAPVRIL